jgi:predicted nucleic acid-binding protein
LTVIVDASVAFKWFVPDEAHAAEAGALLRSEDLLLAPDILVAEVCNIAWRSARMGRIEPEQAIRIATALPGLFASLIGSGVLARRAVEIARELDHPVYDCLYLSLAEARQTTLVTADGRFLAKLSGTAWEANALSLVRYVTQS